MSFQGHHPDPLGVLASTGQVMKRARHVRIDHDGIESAADEITRLHESPPGWDDALHFRDGTWRTAAWVFALDALSFCFWSEDPDNRWRVDYQDQVHDGYWALAAALRRGVDEGFSFWNLGELAEISEDAVAHLLRPADGAPVIPLFEARVEHLRELGCGLLAFTAQHDTAATDSHPAQTFLAAANGSAARLVEQVRSWLPSFNDVSRYQNEEVRFFKRAQILVADLHGAFDGESCGRFDDLEILTAFADYKVPQVLRRLGVLHYEPDLADRVDNLVLIPAGAPEEIEIRSATIWGCELIRQALERRGKQMRAFEIDWALWLAGQQIPPNTRPYHRTLTIYY
jgi:hypothetical protein